MVYSMFQLSLCYAGKIYCRHRLAGVVWKPSPSQSECIWWGLCWNRGEEEFGICWYLLLVGLEHDFVVSFPWVLGISWSQFTKSIIFQRGWNHQAGWYLLISVDILYFWFEIVDPLAWLAKENCNMGQLCDSSHSWVIYWYTRWTFAWYR